VPATAGCPSGQWERTVNPPEYSFEGSNPSPATSVMSQDIGDNGPAIS
jgi:hypothetical protein